MAVRGLMSPPCMAIISSSSGFGLVVQGLAHGHYDLAVFAWSTAITDFVPATVVRVTVR